MILNIEKILTSLITIYRRIERRRLIIDSSTGIALITPIRKDEFIVLFATLAYGN